MDNSAIQELELSMKEAQKFVDMGTSLDRLFNNRDFKKVILEGYFEQEAIRLVHMLSNPNMQSAESQQSLQSQMMGIGQLNGYFRAVQHLASMAQKSVEDYEQTREELLSEDA